MDFVPEAIEEYARAHTTPAEHVFVDLARATRERTGERSGMLSGTSVGRLLQVLAGVSSTPRVLEVGTFTGYSALMMASALPSEGRVVTCDVDERNTAIAREFWARSPHGSKIELRLGPALDTLRELEGPFGLVFIDADKENYVSYYERALELLADDGVIVADNVLWSGRVLDPKEESDRAIVAFNERVQADPRVTNVLLTVRDGLMVIRKART
jgi:caffeoyl-CoA O-methyltransferase